mgnify:CR=1 FL=1
MSRMYTRVTIGLPHQNRIFLDALREVLASQEKSCLISGKKNCQYVRNWMYHITAELKWTRITQHIAFATPEAKIRAIEIAADNLINWYKGTPTSVIM